MSAFIEALGKVDAERKRPGGVCSVAMWRDKQDAETQAQFDAALESERHASLIHQAMRAAGYERTVEPLRRHRRKECSCGDVQ